MTSVMENESVTLPAQIIISKKSRVKETEIYENGCYPVQKIIGFYSGKEKAKYYRVQWAPSWIHEDYLVSCEQLIEQFFVEQNIIKDFRGEPTKVKVEKVNNKDIKNNPPSDGLTAETVGAHNVFENSYYDSSDCEPLSKKTLKVKSKVFNSSNYDSSDNEPLIKKKLKSKKNADCSLQNVTVDTNDNKKVVRITPKTGKPTTRARMTTSSPSSKTNSPISKTNSPNSKSGSPSIKTPSRCVEFISKNIKFENFDSTDGSSSVMKRYRTQQYYKEIPYNLRSVTRCTNMGEKGKGHVIRKVYNTRQHVKHLTMNRKRGGKGAISRGTRQLPFSYKKMSPPQRKFWLRKAETTNRDDSSSIVEEAIKKCTKKISVDDNPAQSTSSSTKQGIMDIKKECSEFDKAILHPQQSFLMQEPLIPVVKQEPESPEDLCTRFRKTWNSCIKDVPVLSNEFNDASDDKLRNSRDSNNFFSDDSDLEVEGKFECDVCEKMFQTSVLLHRHRFIHCAQKSFKFDKRKSGKVDVEDKENLAVGKWQVLSNPSKHDLCSDLFSHHLRPRKENDMQEKK